MADTTFRHGDPLMVDYTPAAGDVSAGEVVVLVSISANTTGAGVCTGIAHRDISNSVQGAVAVGGGVYDVVNLSNAADYAIVYWDDTAKKVTTTSTNNGQFGFIVADGGGGANSTAKAMHHPFA